MKSLGKQFITSGQIHSNLEWTVMPAGCERDYNIGGGSSNLRSTETM